MPTLLQLKKGYFHSSERNENMYSEHFLPSDYYSSSNNVNFNLTQYIMSSTALSCLQRYPVNVLHSGRNNH